MRVSDDRRRKPVLPPTSFVTTDGITGETQIGFAHLPAELVTRRNYETASWYTILDRPAQTVPVYGKLTNGNEIADTSFRYTYGGTIAEAHFPSRLFQHTTPGDRPEMIGKPDTHTPHPYAHAVAISLLTRDGYAETWFEMAANLFALWTPYGDIDSHPGVTAKLVVDPTWEQRDRHDGVQLALDRAPIPHTNPTATYGWAIRKAADALDLHRQAELALGSARSAMRMYGPKTDPVLAGRSHA
jgi:hypothetical protein